MRRFLFAFLLLASPALAVQNNLASTYALGTTTETELTGLQTGITITAPDDDRFVLASLRVQNTQSREVQLTIKIEEDDVVIATETVMLPASATRTVQIPQNRFDLANGSHTYEVLVTSSSSGPLNFQTDSYLLVQGFDVVTGSTTTAMALAVNPADCSANQFAHTIAANGDLTCSAITDAAVPNNITIDNATTATALAANPTDCSANQYANAIAASGNLTCSAISDADVPNNITIDAATALSANPADCSSGQFAHTIAANGDLSCSKEKLFFTGGSSSNTLGTSGTEFLQAIGGNSISATESDTYAIAPAAMTVTTLRVRLETAPGSSTSRIFTLRKNGADTSVTCTVSNTATTCADTSNTATYAAGDTINLKSTVTGTPAATKMQRGLVATVD